MICLGVVELVPLNWSYRAGASSTRFIQECDGGHYTASHTLAKNMTIIKENLLQFITQKVKFPENTTNLFSSDGFCSSITNSSFFASNWELSFSKP